MWEFVMRTVALVLAAAVAASAPTAASAARRPYSPAPKIFDPNADGRNFMAEAMHQFFVPAESLGIIPRLPPNPRPKPHY